MTTTTGRRAWLLVALALLLASWAPRPVGGQPAEAPNAGARAAAELAAEVRAGEVLVVLRPGARAAAVAGRAGLAAADQIAPSVHRLRVPPGEERARAQALRADPGVAAAAPNYLRRAQFVPNDRLYAQQWAPARIGAPSAWDVTVGTAGVAIAILDSGVDQDHPDLAAKLRPGANFLGADPSYDPSSCPTRDGVQDDFDHGTHVSGIAAAATNNGIGVAGIAWQPMILPVKVLDCRGNGSDVQVIAGMDWAVGQGARIINLSFGGAGQSDVLDAAVERAWRAGALVIAAAGNAATDVPFYPAASPHALAITASDRDDHFASSFSNRGPWVSLAAPGVGILSTYPTYMAQYHVQVGYQFKDGTSMAAPHVAGLAALLLSLHPDYSPNRIMAILFISADRIESCPTGISACPYDAHGRNDYFGYGRINAARAVRVANGLLLPLAPQRGGLAD
ncbi:MAG TPA: S8 family serine peptidase [Chloroflexota bacterium]